MRRLYSTFAGGWPGIGLMLMRFVTGVVLVNSAGSVLLGNPSFLIAIASFLLTASAILLIVGLCTPIAGTLVAFVESCSVLARPADWLFCVLVATFGAALAMLGPGLWSIDARLFGWKRIEASPRKS